MAEAMCLAYITTLERSLGAIRMFPEPLLRRVYDTLAPQYGWPQIVDVETPELEDQKKRRDSIKANERTAKRIEEMIAETDDADQLEALHASLKVIEAKTVSLRGGLPAPAGA